MITPDSLKNIKPVQISTNVSDYSMLVYGPSKVGKSVDNETVIPTPNGNKKIKDVIVGDELFDRQGQPTEVLGVYPQGKLEAYEVHLSDGTSFIVNDEHIIPYITSKGNINSKTLKEIMKDYKKVDSVVIDGIDREMVTHKYSIPKSNAVNYDEKELLINPYALGVLIGDGSLTDKDLVISSSEIDVIENFMEYTGLKNFKNDNYRFRFNRKENNDIPSSILNSIVELGLNVKSPERFVPNNYKLGSIKQRIELLKGLIDTDGSVVTTKNSLRYDFSTNSNKLAYDVREVALSLGYGATISEYVREDKEKNEYIVRIYTQTKLSKSLKHNKKEKVENYKPSSKNYKTQIVNIEKVEDREMTCFMVDNHEHLFLINDYIVTHNTTFVYDLYKDKVLFLATEDRHKALAGAHVQPISSWADYEAVLSALSDKELQEQYDVIAIDTVENLYDMALKAILKKYRVKDLSEVAWGKAHGDLKNTWKTKVNMISKLGYQPCFIAHSIEKTMRVPESQMLPSAVDSKAMELKKGEDGEENFYEFNKFAPDLREKILSPINKNVDNILFINNGVDVNGHEKRVIYLRGSLYFEAGNTFRNVVNHTELSAEAYQKAIQNAIDEYPEYVRAEKAFSKDKQFMKEDGDWNFDKLKEQVTGIASELNKLGKINEVHTVTEDVFGSGISIQRDVTPDQAELLEVVLIKLKVKLDKAKEK